MALGDIYQKASLVQIPSGYKAADAELYSVVPNTTAGDFTVSVAAGATRVNKDGLVESVAANQARLDYNPTNPQDPTLLLEPQRTNYATNNSSMDTYGTVGGSSPSPTLTADYTTAPDGSNTATRLQATVTGSNYSLIQFPSTPNGNGTYYISVYAKSNTGSNQTISFYGNSSSTNAHTVTTEWTRIIVEATRGSGLTKYAYLGTWASQHGSDASIDISLWGAQIEVDSNYSTSYIPTLGSAVTRTVDTCKLENFADMPTDYPFTVFWEGRVDDISTNQNAFSILDASSAVKYLSFTFANTGFFQVLRRNVNYDIDSQTFSISVGDVLKIGISFTSNTTYKCYINGSLERNETSGLDVDFDFNDILIGQLRVVSDTGTRNQASQIMLFNEALTDAELTTLTT